jgi:4-amino-4-deoxy-L-arabinose transferase-like glycosyltransferase
VNDAGDRDEPKEPPWARPALALLLVVVAVGYLWDLDRNGWGNTYYAAAVQAATHSWSSMFYGSSDWGDYITVDKPPVSLWIMALSGRVFGFSSWSMLAPQALMGVASVGLLYGAVRRAWGAVAGLVAAALLALTPAAALMFRFNNPDAALTLFLVAAAYALTRAVEKGGTGWLLAAAALLGTAFLTKSLQALLVVPGLAVAYLACAPGRWARRLWQLVAAGAVMLVSGLWWPLIVDLVPEGNRPFIGGSTGNRVLELVVGYNGVSRITGGQGPGQGLGRAPGGGRGPAGGGGFGGEAGWDRMANDLFGGFIAWWLPAALLGAVAAVWLLRGRPRTDPRWAGLVLWTGWTAVTAGIFSFAGGIIHTYYTVALAPGVAALAAMPLPALWRRRDQGVARGFLAGTAAVTAATAFLLMGRAVGWYPWLRWTVLVIGIIGAATLLVPPSTGRVRLPLPLAAGAAAAALVAGVVGPLAWSLVTITTTHTGSVPDVGPAQATSRGGFGHGRAPSGGPPLGRAPSGGAPNGGPPSGGGPFRDGDRVSTELRAMLAAGAKGHRWVAATSSSQTAGSLQLAVDAPVMALGGFSGRDDAITLERFQALVASGQVRYFIAGGGPGGVPGGGPGRAPGREQGGAPGDELAGAHRGGRGPGGGSVESIAAWVSTSFTAVTVGTTTVYDLSGPASKRS